MNSDITAREARLTKILIMLIALWNRVTSLSKHQLTANPLPTGGICSAGRGLPTFDIFRAHYMTWSDFSGNPTFPVPFIIRSSWLAEFVWGSLCKSPKLMWSIGPYAKKRRDLLKHLITSIANEMEAGGVELPDLYLYTFNKSAYINKYCRREQENNLKALVKLKKEIEGGTHSPFGICHQTPTPDIIQHHVKTWKHYSGSSTHPVPYILPKSRRLAKYAYENLNRWGDTRYGDKRRDLLDHLIKSITEELGTNNDG